MQEYWVPIEEFPDYSVSDQGNVISGYGGRLLVHSINQLGLVSVGMMKDGKQHRRSLTLLVAEAFIPNPHYKYDAPTPINLNGDRQDNRAVNLDWRPRWFAINFHKQFKVEPYILPNPLRLIQTGEIFYTSREVAVKYGLLEKEILLDVIMQKGVWPKGFTFEIVDS